MTRIAVLDDWQGLAADIADWSALDGRAEIVFFREAFGDADAAAIALASFDVVVAMRERSRIDRALIAQLPRLRLLSFTGARNASVDIPACTEHGITVCNTVNTRSSHATAELALALLLAAARHLPLADAEMRAGRFQEHVPTGLELAGATLGIVGLGRIGGRMAGYARALGMNVLAWSTNLTEAIAQAAGATRVDKAELLARADAVSLHMVLSDRSRGIIGAADLARMKPGAILVNTSRGPLVDEAALLAALRERRIFAALDTYDREPLPADHALRSAPNTVLTPHLGYVSTPSMTDFYRDSVANILAWLDGTPIHVVNAAPA